MPYSTTPSTGPWSTKDWCDGFIGYSTYFTIPEDQRPHSVKIGRIRRITESREDWLKRVGDVKTKRAA